MNDKIKSLQEQIREEERKISNCKHEFGEPYFDPETKKEPYGFRTVGQGSDVWSEPMGYHDVTVDRWSRKCTKCGFVQSTYNREPVITSYKPKFQ